jgi:hypothetical protein
MMAMFGWTDPKMPAHYIAQANREKLGMSGMDKIVASIRAIRSTTSWRCPTRTGPERQARTE